MPKNTPYELQYLALFEFVFPKWADLPQKVKQSETFGPRNIMAQVTTEALLYGKNERLYFVTACWVPGDEYFAGGDEPKSIGEDGPYVFRLSQLTVEVASWQDPRILERIQNGQWANIDQFRGNLFRALTGTADVLESRARMLRQAAEQFGFNGMNIYAGR